MKPIARNCMQTILSRTLTKHQKQNAMIQANSVHAGTNKEEPAHKSKEDVNIRDGHDWNKDGSKQQPLFKFGLLADIQYCDVDDRANFSGSQIRRYRNALNVVKNAIEHFNKDDDDDFEDDDGGKAKKKRVGGVDFIVHNGDIIDHQCAFDFELDEFRPKEEGRRQLSDVMQILDRAKCRKFIFTVGNHELYNFTKEELREGVRCEKGKYKLAFKCANADGDMYYVEKPHEKWKVIVLNPYDVSIYSNGREQGLDVKALELLRKNNPNADKWCEENPEVVQTERMSGTFPYFKDLEGLNGRWVPFNGGVGEQQLEFLRKELKSSNERNEKVLIFCHLLVHPKTTSGTGRTLLWNYDEVLSVIQNVGNGCVKCVFSGHQHEGGVHVDEFGTHFVVLESPMLASDEDKGHPGPFCVVEVNENSVLMKGFGRSFESHLFPYEEGKSFVVDRGSEREILEYRIDLK